MASSIKTAYALVDWHNLTGYPNIAYGKDPRREIPTAVLRLQEQIARALTTLGDGQRFRVVMRIYHGWHKGRESMPVRLDFEHYAASNATARRIANVVFGQELQFGSDLLCHDGAHSLYSTYRGMNQEKGQKMIDTSIVCDSLHLHRFGLADVTVIVGDDDDFIPAMLTAQAWKAKMILLRKPNSVVSHTTDVDCTNSLYFWSEE